MVSKLMSILSKALDLLNRVTEVIGYAVTGYAKVEEKRVELEAKLNKYARYIIIGAVTGGAALIVILLIRCIVKKCKKCKEKRMRKKLEKQLALEV